MSSGTLGWQPNAGADEGFRSRFLTVPHVVDHWISEYGTLRGSDVLDFGCGEGVSALGLALNYQPRSVVGVDIMPDPGHCPAVARACLGLEALPPNLRLHRVSPGSLHDPRDRFDIVYSWSVFEHVDQRLLDATLGLVKQALRPTGLFLAQIAPLYYSSGGSHLLHRIPEPWGHLTTQLDVYYGRLCEAVPDPGEREALWSTFMTLNRITAPELLQRIERAGFEIVRTYTTRDKEEPPERLLAIFDRAILTTNQVVVLARPGGGRSAHEKPWRRRFARTLKGTARAVRSRLLPR